MIIIDNKIISADVIERQFICNLNACKGACCKEGDFGAPLEPEEQQTIDKIYPIVKPFLSKASNDRIEQLGTNQWYEEPKEHGTTLLPDGACVFMTRDALGIAHCGIEQAYNEGLTDFKKPISCHLYPIRIESNDKFDHLNYDVWDICSAACDLGKEKEVAVYQFVKDALIRKYGEDFYDQLADAANQYQHWSENPE